MSRKAESAVRRAARKAYWGEDDARVLVAALAESGQSLVQFARRHDVDPRRLGRWRSRLARGAGEGVRFHPVQLVASESAREPERGGIEIELVGGRRIHVGRGFDAEDLRLVVAVLEDASGC